MGTEFRVELSDLLARFSVLSLVGDGQVFRLINRILRNSAFAMDPIGNEVCRGRENWVHYAWIREEVQDPAVESRA